MKVFRDKQCFNTQFAHMSSVFCPDRQPPPMPLSLNNNCPSDSKAPFQVPSKSTQLPLSKTSPFKRIWLSLSLLKMVVISNTPTASTWHDFRRKHHKLFFQFLFQVKLKLPSRNYFKVLITLTTHICPVIFNRHCWRPPIFMKSSKFVCRAAIFVQTVSFMHKLSMEMRQLTVSACICPLLWILWEKLKRSN